MARSIRSHCRGCLVHAQRGPCPHASAALPQPAWTAQLQHSTRDQRYSLAGLHSSRQQRKGARTRAALAYGDDSTEISREATMEEYMQLKQFLLRRTQRAAGFVTLYILLAVSGEAALCAAIGGLGSYVYTAWLCADVDRLTPDDDIPMIRANDIRDAWPRRFARLIAGLQQQLQPRLLVPVALAAAVAMYNTQSGDHLTLAEEGSLVIGFFSFKIAHILFLYRELKPKFDSDGQTRRIPRMDGIEDIQMDIYARDTRQLQAIEDADRVLAEEEDKKRRRQG